MRFKRPIKITHGLDRTTIIPLINVMFLLIIFFILTFTLSAPSGIFVKLPKAVTSESIKEENIVIIVTSENVVYWDGKAIAMQKLRQILSQKKNRKRPILIKADRRASLGRLIDIWNMCRELSVPQINIATTQGE